LHQVWDCYSLHKHAGRCSLTDDTADMPGTAIMPGRRVHGEFARAWVHCMAWRLTARVYTGLPLTCLSLLQPLICTPALELQRVLPAGPYMTAWVTVQPVDALLTVTCLAPACVAVVGGVLLFLRQVPECPASPQWPLISMRVTSTCMLPAGAVRMCLAKEACSLKGG
jgi:hypothetical protein